ncbi:hypothetical protein BGZ67_009018 [Mortierella alpina]|nr:hypothetical protein BGZ67_009018 [Mortierella alpina]
MTIYAKAAPSHLNNQGDKTWKLSPYSPLTKCVLNAIRVYPGNDHIPLAELPAEPMQDAFPLQSPVVNSPEVRTLGCDPPADQPQPELQTFMNLWNDHSTSDHIKHLSELRAHLDSAPTSSPRPANSSQRTPSKTSRRTQRVRKVQPQIVSGSRPSSTSHKKSSTNPFYSKCSEFASSSPPSSSTDLASNSCKSRSRRRLKIEEAEYLLDQFETNEKPTSKERASIAARLNLDSRTVQVWFQNRRAKLKRDDCLANHLMAEGQEKPNDRDNDHRVDQDVESDTIIDTTNLDGLTTAACSSVQAQPSAHLGSGAGTFLGYECSYVDAGWSRLFESELAQLPNLDDLQLSTSLAGSEAFPDMHVAIDQFDMSTIDLVFGLDYENELLVPNVTPVGQCLEARRPLGEEALSAALVSRTNLVNRHPRRQATLSGLKHDPAVPMRNPPLRKASVMARLHSQIPIQQMAFTLVTDPSHAA